MITPIERLSAISPVESGESKTPAAGGRVFSDILDSAIQNVRETDAEKTQAEYLLATGQLDNPAAMNIAIYKNQIAVNLLIQLRNKSLDAYSELMRINL